MIAGVDEQRFTRAVAVGDLVSRLGAGRLFLCVQIGYAVSLRVLTGDIGKATMLRHAGVSFLG